jgi:hypothetical protein
MVVVTTQEYAKSLIRVRGERNLVDVLEKSQKNRLWIANNYQVLRAKYPNRYIAVRDEGKTIIDAASFPELYEKLREMYNKDIEDFALTFISLKKLKLLVPYLHPQTLVRV